MCSSVASLESCAERLPGARRLASGSMALSPLDGRLDGAHRGGAPSRQSQRGLPLRPRPDAGAPPVKPGRAQAGGKPRAGASLGGEIGDRSY